MELGLAKKERNKERRNDSFWTKICFEWNEATNV